MTFVPYFPVTYDSNEDEILQLEEEIKDATAHRNYAKADQMQTRLDYCLQVRKYFLNQDDKTERMNQVQRLEQQRYEEEKQIKERMCREMDKVLQDAEIRFEQMEQRHQNELDALERKFSDPHFSSLRFSPDVRCLLKAEAFYAKHRQFKVANGMKYNLTMRTKAEVQQTDSNAAQTVDATVESTILRHQKEMEGFKKKLESDKMRINKETARELLTLKNKYGKLRRRILYHSDEDPVKEESRPDKAEIFQTLDEGFNPLIENASVVEYKPSAPIMTRSAHASRRMLARYTGGFSPRNPRVAHALERSLKCDFASTI